MELKPLIQSLALCGLLTTVPVQVYADASQKDAAPATKQANDALCQQLPFDNKTDFTDAHKGFIAALPDAVIKGEGGNLFWDPKKYAFIKEGEKAPDTVSARHS